MTTAECQNPPEGWRCTRAPGHDGPCAAYPAGDSKPIVPTPEQARELAAELSRILITREGDAKFGIVAFWRRHLIIAALEAYGEEAQP